MPVENNNVLCKISRLMDVVNFFSGGGQNLDIQQIQKQAKLFLDASRTSLIERPFYTLINVMRPLINKGKSELAAYFSFYAIRALQENAGNVVFNIHDFDRNVLQKNNEINMASIQMPFKSQMFSLASSKLRLGKKTIHNWVIAVDDSPVFNLAKKAFFLNISFESDEYIQAMESCVFILKSNDEIELSVTQALLTEEEAAFFLKASLFLGCAISNRKKDVIEQKKREIAALKTKTSTKKRKKKNHRPHVLNVFKPKKPTHSTEKPSGIGVKRGELEYQRPTEGHFRTYWVKPENAETLASKRELKGFEVVVIKDEVKNGKVAMVTSVEPFIARKDKPVRPGGSVRDVK